MHAAAAGILRDVRSFAPPEPRYCVVTAVEVDPRTCCSR
jgi:hypothetical protein